MSLSVNAYPVTMGRGIRNLIWGRVLLKEDASAGDTTIKVGCEFEHPWALANIPGTMAFYGVTNDITIVQPGATDTPNDVEYSEDVTIAGLSDADLHLKIAGTLDHDYTTARGAYVRYRDADLPSYVSDLQVVEEDFADSGLTEPEEKWFPGVCVIELDRRRTPHTNVTWDERWRFVVRYYEVMDSNYDRQAFKDTVDSIADMILQDHTLGGTALDSLADVAHYGGHQGVNARGGLVRLKNQYNIDWADIAVYGIRVRAYDKITGI